MTCDQLNLQMRGPTRALFFWKNNITGKNFLQNFFNNLHRGFSNSRYFHFHLVRPYLFFLDIVCVTENYLNNHTEVFLGKGILKICSKFTGKYPCRSAISIKLLWLFLRLFLWCSLIQKNQNHFVSLEIRLNWWYHL